MSASAAYWLAVAAPVGLPNHAPIVRLVDGAMSGVGHRPIAARVDLPVCRLRKCVRRHRAGVAAIRLIVIALVGGLGIALWQPYAARVAEDQARSQAAVATASSVVRTRDVIEPANPHRNTRDIRLTDALIMGGERIDERFHDNAHLRVAAAPAKDQRGDGGRGNVATD